MLNSTLVESKKVKVSEFVTKNVPREFILDFIDKFMEQTKGISWEDSKNLSYDNDFLLNCLFYATMGL